MGPSQGVPAQILEVPIPGPSSMNVLSFFKPSEGERGREEAGEGGRRNVAQTHKQVHSQWAPWSWLGVSAASTSKRPAWA